MTPLDIYAILDTVANVVIALTAVLAAVYGVFQLHTARVANQQVLDGQKAAAEAAVAASEQEKRDSIARTRPYLWAQIVPSVAAQSVDLRLTNTGRTAARRITMSITPEVIPVPRSDGQTSIEARMLEAFDQPALTLPPGASLRYLWCRMGKNQHDGMPLKGELTIKYRSEDSAEPYTEVYPFDLATGLVPLPSEGSEATGNDKHTRNIALAIRGVARNIGELNR